jgi:phage repressor protein C with HTH and peptisase S24 domain/transcriptional regulator with XRE-family HTH domain
MDEDIIKRIREIMSFYSMNTSQFAEKTNINQANLSSMLNGKRVIGNGIINKICISFDNINKDWLLSGDGKMFREEVVRQESLFPELKDIFDRIKELSIIKGVTMYTVSKDTGIPLSNLFHSKSDKYNGISPRYIEKLADYYNVNADWLLTGRGDAYDPGIVQDTMIKDGALWNRLSDIINVYHGGKDENIYNLSDYTGISVIRLIQMIKDNTWPLYSEIQKIIKSEKLNISARWLLTGEGPMLKTEKEKDNLTAAGNTQETRPRIPLNAAAGSVSVALSGVSDADCEQLPLVSAFSNYNYTVLVKGDSMEPEFHSGDELACLQLNGKANFIQWGRYHVLDTSQGVVVKRIYDSGDSILCKSENELYSDFKIHKEDIYNISLVIGMLRRF